MVMCGDLPRDLWDQERVLVYHRKERKKCPNNEGNIADTGYENGWTFKKRQKDIYTYD